MAESARPLLRTAASGLLLVLCAAAFDAEPLYVPGFAALLLALLATVWVLVGRRGLRVTRTVSARRVVEEEPVTVALRVHARRRLPTGALLDPLLMTPWRLPVGRREAGVRVEVRFGRRGRRVLQPPRVAVQDPLRLLTRMAGGLGVGRHEVLVLPRLEPVRNVSGDGDDAGALLARRRSSVAAEVELDGLRRHREGSPASRIFWPSVAKGGELLERRLRADSDTRPLVVLDPRAPASEGDLDAAVRAAASLVVVLARAGGSALLLPGDRRPIPLDPELAGWPHLHARLALVVADTPPTLSGLAARRGPIVYVAARRLTRPPRALAHAPGGGRVLVVPAVIGTRRPSFTVAGCMGYAFSQARRPTAKAS